MLSLRRSVLKGALFILMAIALPTLTYGTPVTYYFSFTAEDLRVAYANEYNNPERLSVQPGDYYDSVTFPLSEVGLLDFYARPDDPDAIGAATWTIALVKAPTFSGSPDPVYQTSTNQVPPTTPNDYAVDAARPWTRWSDIEDLTDYYLTDYVGDLTGSNGNPAGRLAPTAKYTVAVTFSEALASVQPVRFIWHVYGSQIDGGLGDTTKDVYYGAFYASASAAVPEPSTYVMAGMGLLGIVVLKRRTKKVKT